MEIKKKLLPTGASQYACWELILVLLFLHSRIKFGQLSFDAWPPLSSMQVGHSCAVTHLPYTDSPTPFHITFTISFFFLFLFLFVLYIAIELETKKWYLLEKKKKPKSGFSKGIETTCIY